MLQILVILLQVIQLASFICELLNEVKNVAWLKGFIAGVIFRKSFFQNEWPNLKGFFI